MKVKMSNIGLKRRTLRAFPPLKAEHPLVGKTCPACHKVFEVGDRVTLVPTFPADNEEFHRAREGRGFSSEAEPIHPSCARVLGHNVEDTILSPPG